MESVTSGQLLPISCYSKFKLCQVQDFIYPEAITPPVDDLYKMANPIRNAKHGLPLAELLDRRSVEFTVDEEAVDPKPSQIRPFEFDKFQHLLKFECIDTGEEEAGSSAATPFSVMEAEMTDLLLDGKIKKRVLREGSIRIEENAIVLAHYSCYTEMEEIPFDSSCLRSAKPERLKLGKAALYAGFEMALLSMTVGEKAEFLIHPDLAYGCLGSPGRIPPNATILMIVEVFKTVDPYLAEEELSFEDRKDFTKVYKVAKAINSTGNGCFQLSVMQALGLYTKAENLLNGCSTRSDDEEEKWKRLMVKIQLNLAIAYNTAKMRFPKRALIAVKKAFEIVPNSPKSAKLYYNRGVAFAIMGEYFLALQAFEKARSLYPDSALLAEKIKKVEGELRASSLDEAIEFPRFDRWADFGIHDTADDEYSLAGTRLLEDFAQDDRKVLKISDVLTDEEKQFLKDEAHRLKLTYSETTPGLILLSKSEIMVGKPEPIARIQ